MITIETKSKMGFPCNLEHGWISTMLAVIDGQSLNGNHLISTLPNRGPGTR